MRSDAVLQCQRRGHVRLLAVLSGPPTRLHMPTSFAACLAVPRQELLVVAGEEPPEGALSQLAADVVTLADRDNDGCVRCAILRGLMLRGRSAGRPGRGWDARPAFARAAWLTTCCAAHRQLALQPCVCTLPSALRRQLGGPLPVRTCCVSLTDVTQPSLWACSFDEFFQFAMRYPSFRELAGVQSLTSNIYSQRAVRSSLRWAVAAAPAAGAWAAWAARAGRLQRLHGSSVKAACLLSRSKAWVPAAVLRAVGMHVPVHDAGRARILCHAVQLIAGVG